MFLRLRRRRPAEAARPSSSGSPPGEGWLPLEPAATAPPGVPLGDLEPTRQPDSGRGKAIESKRGSQR